jgi:hypothetical protein
MAHHAHARVELTRSVSKPISRASARGPRRKPALPTWFMLVICALRPARFSMMLPRFSLGISTNSFSIGSSNCHWVFFPKHFRARHQELHGLRGASARREWRSAFRRVRSRQKLSGPRLRHAQRDVRADFLHEPVPDVPRGDELAVLAGERPSFTANSIWIVGGSIGM